MTTRCPWSDPRPTRSTVAGVCLLAVVGWVLLPSTVLAQLEEPLPRLVADVQGALPRLPTDPALAVARGVPAANLPAWGPGLGAGAHFYPLRGRRMTLGVGATVEWLRGTGTPDVPEGADPTRFGPSVTTRFTAVSPQVSVNFGQRRGWSYLSAGVGASTLTVSRADRPAESGESVRTWNYGGGARWFARPHLAFSFDLRFYRLPTLPPGERSAGYPATTLVVLHLGLSIQ